MNINLNGKTALVCGASKGIGKSIAVEFSKAGANVILVARSLKDLTNVSSLLEGNSHKYIVADLQNPLQAAGVIKSQLPSNDCIDILVNNSGGPPAGKISKADNEDFVTAFERLILSSHTLTQLVLPGMISRNWGRIINIISISVKQPVDNLGVSNTIRGAAASWAKSMANELAQYGVNVNSILPGFTSTERLTTLIQNTAKNSNLSEDQVTKQILSQIPLGRFVAPEEIAYLALFLSSSFAEAISGTSIPVDGGYLRTI